MSKLMLHAGGQLATIDEVRAVKVPPAEGRWHPTGHAKVLDGVTETLAGAGYAIKNQQLALARDGKRFFGVLDLDSPLGDGVGLTVGVRNSIDRSFPLGFAAGSRVFVCDNLAFNAELMVRRKHTKNGERDFGRNIAAAVAGLSQFREIEARRIELMRATDVTDERAESLILRSWEKGIITTPALPLVLTEYREPPHEEFMARTLWALLNAFTSVLKPMSVTTPARFLAATMRLNALLAPPQEIANAA